jgi:hypothetical protein
VTASARFISGDVYAALHPCPDRARTRLRFGGLGLRNAEPRRSADHAGFGISNCAKLAADLKPSAGLDHQANYLLFYWVQGYVSAANFLLLNEYHNYVDMNGVQVATILKLIVDHCKAHPNDKPISAIDKFIRDAKKVEVDEKEVFNPWPQ